MTIQVGMKVTDLEGIFLAQSSHLQASPDHVIKRDVSYFSVECDATLKRIPRDACHLGLRAQSHPDSPDQPSDDFTFSLILAAGSLNSVSIDIPFDCLVSPDELLMHAESSGFNINLLPPSCTTDVDESVDRYCEVLRTYGKMWLTSPQSNIRVAPIDGYLEYLFGVAAGHIPATISTDEMMNTLFTDGMPEAVMERVKVVIHEVIMEHFGNEGEFTAILEKVAKAIHLKQAQFRDSRARMLEEELDLRTPVPNLIRMVSKSTGLSVADSAGMLFELKHGIHTVLDKYLPPDVPAVEGQTAPPVNAQQANLARALCTAFGAAFGVESLADAWAGIESSLQVNERINLDHGTVQPGPAATRLAQAMGVEPKVAALATGEFLSMIRATLEAGSHVSPPPPPTPKPVPAPASGLIAVG
ncbi:hypothetical protein IIE18_11320 [Pseudomonas sp. V1]|uniref:hypothetical protein n=1 Tax=Pseudomonas arcuscaelestis TaxID=2710591 RepID=UPI00193EF837|nr:hypothetical protein [Pseudomonas arcuscaelestis]MBM3105731.1 hypothetical protein [Pseudomonas arcuscaelestis]